MYFLVLVVDGSRMSLMGSDTLSGTPAGDLKATLTPVLYNGVYYICGGTYTNKAANFACTFYYNFINTTGSDFSGATMSVSFDNYGYIVLNGVKYPSTNPNMSLGYEGIGGAFDQSLTNFTVTIPKGLNTIELRCVNMSTTTGLNVWESQGTGVQPNNPSATWLRITSSTSTVLIKTDATWNCRQFDYPAKFVRPLSLGDVAENAGFTNKPYSLAALAGKTMLDNSMNATTFTYPVSLFTADFKTFIFPAMPPAESITFNQGGYVFYNNTASGVVQQPSSFLLAGENRNYAATSIYVQNNMNLTQLQNYPQDDRSLATLFITDWGIPGTKGWYRFRGRTVFGRYIGGSGHWWSISWIQKP